MAATSANHYAAGMSSDIATVRIELVDTDPLIWRQVEVPTAMTLKALHDVIQVVMAWSNSHLWEFKIGKRRQPTSLSTIDLAEPQVCSVRLWKEWLHIWPPNLAEEPGGC